MSAPRRKRRIAADEAHAWARNLRLRNPYAKLILSMLTLYVNGEGSCFVSLTQLGEDCEFAPETVRRRLLWLETIGAIVRIPQWRDESGRLNSEGRGKRTTDEIRLLMDGDPEIIEAAAAGKIDGGEENSPSEPTEISHPSRKVAKFDEQEALAPPLATQQPPSQPSNCGGGLISEPEPEPESPPTPSQARGDEDEFEQRRLGAERLRLIEPIWPDPIADAHRATNVLQVLTEIEWSDCLTGAKGYAKFIREKRTDGQKRIAKDFHNWARNQQWVGYLTVGKKLETIAETVRIAVDSEDGKAWAALHRIAHIRPLDFKGIYVLPGPLSAQVLALAQAPRDIEWEFISERAINQCGAWSEFIAAELKDKARPKLVASWGDNPQSAIGFRAPWPWPPRKDGTLSSTGPPETLMTEQDMRDFA
jgi:hypothetical protein